MRSQGSDLHRSLTERCGNEYGFREVANVCVCVCMCDVGLRQGSGLRDTASWLVPHLAAGPLQIVHSFFHISF